LGIPWYRNQRASYLAVLPDLTNVKRAVIEYGALFLLYFLDGLIEPFIVHCNKKLTFRSCLELSLIGHKPPLRETG